MPGWFERWATRRREKEMTQYLRSLQGMDDDEIGGVLVVATHIRNRLAEHYGIDVLHPQMYPGGANAGAIHMRRLAQEFQRKGELSDAAGAMVWLHSYRAVACPELRMTGRRIWGELRRGMPHVITQAMTMASVIGTLPDIWGSDNIPDGLDPDGGSRADRAAE